ncbi:hypothetical protein CRENBAI_007092 [Crenichthys baileyi]|uniref:Uncharacterized protein n=1 Tax=Crenichthys baileyi TaxID=28760 RepID=A0AAV9SL50_9TELE
MVGHNTATSSLFNRAWPSGEKGLGGLLRITEDGIDPDFDGCCSSYKRSCTSPGSGDMLPGLQPTPLTLDTPAFCTPPPSEGSSPSGPAAHATTAVSRLNSNPAPNHIRIWAHPFITHP